MADYGIKITRTGADVSSTDLRDYVLHSGYKTLKAKARATTTMTLPAGTTTITKTIAHGLGYAPMFHIMGEMNSGKWYALHTIQAITIDSAPTFAFLISVDTDATNLSIILNSGTTFGTDQVFNITYYIIIDEVV